MKRLFFLRILSFKTLNLFDTKRIAKMSRQEETLEDA